MIGGGGEWERGRESRVASSTHIQACLSVHNVVEAVDVAEGRVGGVLQDDDVILLYKGLVRQQVLTGGRAQRENSSGLEGTGDKQ